MMNEQRCVRSTLAPYGTLALVAGLAAILGTACQTTTGAENAEAPEQTEQTAQQQAQSQAPGAELPKEGLVLWLQPDRAHLELDSGEVVTWQDASGNENHLEAAGQDMRPSFDDSADQEPPAVRFDGQDDMLLRDGFSPDQLPAATVFIVAAPSASAGNFDALLSAGNRGAEDSFTGFNIDLGGKNFAECADSFPDPTSALNTVNVQSAKTTVDCGQDLLDKSVPFERDSLLAVRIDNDETSLRLDGAPQQAAGGGSDTLVVPQLRLGARYHRQKFQGYYDGEISEVLVYGRSLTDEEVAQVERYLAKRHQIPLDE